MPRTVSEGIHQGLADMQALQSGAIENALKKMQVGIYAQRLRALAGGGDGMNMPGYVYSPLTGTMVRDLSDQEIGRQEKAKLKAGNEITDEQSGNSSQPSINPSEPPKVLGNGGNGPLGIPPNGPLGITGNQSLASGAGIPLTVQEISGGKKTLKQDPVALKAGEKSAELQATAEPLVQQAINSLKLHGQAYTEAMKGTPGGLQAGRMAGLANSAAGMTGENPGVIPYETLADNTAWELAKISNPSGRPTEESKNDFKKMLPKASGWADNPKEVSNKVKNLYKAAIGKRYAVMNRPYNPNDPQIEKDAQDIANSFVSSSGKKVGRFTIQES